MIWCALLSGDLFTRTQNFNKPQQRTPSSDSIHAFIFHSLSSRSNNTVTKTEADTELLLLWSWLASRLTIDKVSLMENGLELQQPSHLWLHPRQ